MEIKIESLEKEFQELIEKRKQDIQLAVTKKVDKFKLWYLIAEKLISLIGYLLVCYFVSWQLAIGIYLIQWSNNMGQLRDQSQDKKFNFWKEIWRY